MSDQWLTVLAPALHEVDDSSMNASCAHRVRSCAEGATMALNRQGYQAFQMVGGAQLRVPGAATSVHYHPCASRLE